MGNKESKEAEPEKQDENGNIDEETKASSAKRNLKRLKKTLGQNQTLIISSALEAGLHKIVETLTEEELMSDVTIHLGIVNGITTKAAGVTEATENVARNNFHLYKIVTVVGESMERFIKEFKDKKAKGEKWESADDVLEYLAVCCEAFSQIAKIKPQKQWLKIENMHHYVLESMKLDLENEKIAFWGTNALYYMVKDGAGVNVEYIEALDKAGARGTLNDVVMMQPDSDELKAHIQLLLSCFETLLMNEDNYLSMTSTLESKAGKAVARDNSANVFGLFAGSPK